MRLWILSDLRLDVDASWSPPAIPEADVAVVAGDVMEGGVEPALRWLARTIRPSMRVAYVAGNHEFYRRCHGDELASGRSTASQLGIDFLEDEVVWYGDVAVAGCTLWTDYGFDGRDRAGDAMEAARRAMMDHRSIDRSRRPRRRPFRPEDAAAVHRASRARLETLASQAAWRMSRARVVVTHHVPTAASMDPRFDGNPLNPAFGSRLEDLVARLGADMWIHGHTHASQDCRLGRTRVLCNPKGYGFQNRDFDPALVVEVPDPSPAPPTEAA